VVNISSKWLPHMKMWEIFFSSLKLFSGKMAAALWCLLSLHKGLHSRDNANLHGVGDKSQALKEDGFSIRVGIDKAASHSE